MSYPVMVGEQDPSWHEGRYCEFNLPGEGWVCTLRPGHLGQHVAHRNGRVLQIWPDIPPGMEVEEGL